MYLNENRFNEKCVKYNIYDENGECDEFSWSKHLKENILFWNINQELI